MGDLLQISVIFFKKCKIQGNYWQVYQSHKSSWHFNKIFFDRISRL